MVYDNNIVSTLLMKKNLLTVDNCDEKNCWLGFIWEIYPSNNNGNACKDIPMGRLKIYDISLSVDGTEYINNNKWKT